MARILLIRTDAIGDALAATPLIAALRENRHEVGIVLSNLNAGIFDTSAFSHQHVLDRIPWPKHGSTAASYARSLAEIRDAQYDAALIASEEPEEYTLACEAEIPARIGFHNGLQKPLKSLWVISRCSRAIYRPAWAAHATEHEVETLYKLGTDYVARPAPPRDREMLAPLLLAELPARDSSVVVQVTPKWLTAGVDGAALAGILRAFASPKLRAIAARSEAEFAGAIAAQASVELEVFSALEPWKIAIARASMIVTPDTGAAHLAGMLGTPCVDCFPAKDFAVRVKRWSPWAAPYVPLAFPAGTAAAAIVSRLVDATREVERLAA